MMFSKTQTPCETESKALRDVPHPAKHGNEDQIAADAEKRTPEYGLRIGFSGSFCHVERAQRTQKRGKEGQKMIRRI